MRARLKQSLAIHGSRLFRLAHSIRFRLTLWFVLILAVVLGLFSGFVYTRTAREMRIEAINLLQNRARRLEGFYPLQGQETHDDDSVQFPGLTITPGNGLQEEEILAVISQQGQILKKSGTISDNQLKEFFNSNIKKDTALFGKHQQGGLAYNFSNDDSQSAVGNYIFLVTPMSFDHTGAGILLFGRPVDPNGRLSRLQMTLTLATLLTLVLAFAFGYGLADRAMRPVQAITRAAREIGETDLNRRLNLGTQDELGELADTFDQMLARLQTAFERQRQFTADASHELRTPLTIVNLEASRALSGRRSPHEYERALGVIRSENEFMTRLVNDLLTLARMDAGQTVLKIEPVDLSDVALEVVERLAPLASRNQVQLRTGDLPELVVQGDRQYLGQMLANLVENAIKYSAGDEKQVMIETGSRPFEKGKQAWVRVSDNGPGIGPEHLPLLFDRFYQVNKARTRQPNEADDLQALSGSGLGLSLVQWIAQAHGGEVSVRSQPGVGSAFEVSLPLAANSV